MCLDFPDSSFITQASRQRQILYLGMAIYHDDLSKQLSTKVHGSQLVMYVVEMTLSHYRSGQCLPWGQLAIKIVSMFEVAQFFCSGLSSVCQAAAHEIHLFWKYICVHCIDLPSIVLFS